MAKLTSNQILHTAKLAKLDLTQKEIKKFTHQLSAVIDLIDELSEVDTKNVEPTGQTTGLTNITRADQIKVEKCLTQDEAISGTDNTKNGYFEVPQILKKL